MSALIIVRKSDRTELLSDAALYDPVSDTIGAIHSKMVPLPELNCVMAGRGPIPVLWITAYLAGLTSKTFDDIVANFGAIREQAATYNNGDVSAEDWARSDIALVGWSESRDHPESYMSIGKNVRDCQTEEVLKDCGLGLFADCSAELAEAFFESLGADPDTFDAETDGIAVMELMRQATVSTGGEGRSEFGGRYVGGYIEKATVTRAGVTTQVIHEWPDEIGKPITPETSTMFAKFSELAV
jgi:hypothetical protein